MKKLTLLSLVLAGCGSKDVLIQHCNVSKIDNKSTITCPDGSNTDVLDGVIGATGAQGDAGVAGAAAPTPTPQPDTQALIDQENVYRESLGQTALTSGLSCNVQALSSGQWLSSSSPGYNSGQGVVVVQSGSTNYSYLFQDAFNQPSATSGPNTLLPTALQPLYVSINYKISCSGQIVVTDTGYYNFDLNSDDGSILTIDGAQVVNNDSNHGMTSKTGTKLLRRGVHTFSMLYAQTGGGSFGLILKANGSVVPGSVWYH